MFTQGDYQKVCRALANGYKRVRYDNGHEVEFQTGDELRATKASIEAALGLNSAGQPLGQSFDRTVAVYDSGR